MSNRLLARAAAAALALAALGTAAKAAEPAAVHGAKTVGALTFETRGLATGPADVLRQGGFATAGAARWIKAPAVAAEARAAAY